MRMLNAHYALQNFAMHMVVGHVPFLPNVLDFWGKDGNVPFSEKQTWEPYSEPTFFVASN
jgi:hypothetical protein